MYTRTAMEVAAEELVPYHHLKIELGKREASQEAGQGKPELDDHSFLSILSSVAASTIFSYVL